MKILSSIASAVMLSGCAHVNPNIPAIDAVAVSLDPQCHVGTYRLADGATVDVRTANDGTLLLWQHWNGAQGNLRPGTQGWESYLGVTSLDPRHDVVLGSCKQGLASFDGLVARRITFKTDEITFTSNDATLRGRLTREADNEPAALVVLAHGSGDNSALDSDFRQRLFAANGVVTFTYDKRGTGLSGGRYTQDFELLAADLAAAYEIARNLAPYATRSGFRGTSQAGWIIPLALLRTRADFAIVNSGIAASPAVEDRNEVMAGLRNAGWGEIELAKAREVTDATARVIGSNFTAGFAEFNRTVAAYRDEPWFGDLGGEYTGEMVKFTADQLRAGGPARQNGTPWLHDAQSVLAKVQTPMLWIIAGKDSEGPGPETPDAICRFVAQGHPFDAIRFAGTEHGGFTFVEHDGRRLRTGYAAGLFAAEIAFAKRSSLPSLPTGARLCSD